MVDTNLSARAGANIGIEPSLLPYVRAGAAPIIELNQAGNTVLMGAAPVPQAARVPFAIDDIGIGGHLWNPDLINNKLINISFVDELGNSIVVATVPLQAHPVEDILLQSANGWLFFCLAAGETIVAGQPVTPPGPPS